MNFRIEEVDERFLPFVWKNPVWRGLMCVGGVVVLVENPLPVTFQEAVLLCEGFDDNRALSRPKQLSLPLRCIMKVLDETKIKKT